MVSGVKAWEPNSSMGVGHLDAICCRTTSPTQNLEKWKWKCSNLLFCSDVGVLEIIDCIVHMSSRPVGCVILALMNEMKITSTYSAGRKVVGPEFLKVNFYDIKNPSTQKEYFY